MPKTNPRNRRRARPSLTDAEREQRRSAQRELVVASIEQLRNSDGWRAYLQARRRLHARVFGRYLERGVSPVHAPAAFVVGVMSTIAGQLA